MCCIVFLPLVSTTWATTLTWSKILSPNKDSKLGLSTLRAIVLFLSSSSNTATILGRGGRAIFEPLPMQEAASQHPHIIWEKALCKRQWEQGEMWDLDTGKRLAAEKRGNLKGGCHFSSIQRGAAWEPRHKVYKGLSNRNEQRILQMLEWVSLFRKHLGWLIPHSKKIVDKCSILQTKT